MGLYTDIIPPFIVDYYSLNGKHYIWTKYVATRKGLEAHRLLAYGEQVDGIRIVALHHYDSKDIAAMLKPVRPTTRKVKKKLDVRIYFMLLVVFSMIVYSAYDFEVVLLCYFPLMVSYLFFSPKVFNKQHTHVKKEEMPLFPANEQWVLIDNSLLYTGSKEYEAFEDMLKEKGIGLVIFADDGSSKAVIEIKPVAKEGLFVNDYEDGEEMKMDLGLIHKPFLLEIWLWILNNVFGIKAIKK
jgi:Ca2+/Na+ antiporter